jgi:hypothetical protein
LKRTHNETFLKNGQIYMNLLRSTCKKRCQHWKDYALHYEHTAIAIRSQARIFV